MYHHIADLQSDVWDIAVSPSNFEQHLEVLNQQKNVVSLYEMIDILQTNTLKHDAIAISFDDGYLDNYTTAVPLLKKYDLPATFFITSKQPGHSDFFWWDELEYIFLFAENLPGYFEMIIDSKTIKATLDNETLLSPALQAKHEKWNACEELPPTKRGELFYKVWEVLKPLSTSQQSQYLSKIKTWSNATMPAESLYKVMSTDQVLAVANDSLFSIGAHTQTHIALGFHDYDTQKNEIEGNRNYLKTVTEKNIDLLAYPYGNYNTATQDICSECGLKAAFTTESLHIATLTQPYRLGRFKVENDNGKIFKRKLNQWLSL